MSNKTTFSFLIKQEDKQIIINKLKKYQLENNNKFVEILFFINDAKIIIYKSQKCVIQGKNVIEIMQNYFPGYLNDIQNNFENNLIYNYKSLIGSDEVGVGDYFGGLIVCAVCINNSQLDWLKEIGVNDSKKINDAKIINIAQQLIKSVKYCVTQIEPIKYNKLYDEFHNSHILKAIMHNYAIDTLIKKNYIDTNKTWIVIDQFVNKQKYYDYLKNANVSPIVNINEFKTHAETSNIAVACASIIARYYFLKQINKISKQINIEVPLGGWNHKIELIVNEIKNKVGSDQLYKYVKLHFKNTLKIH